MALGQRRTTHCNWPGCYTPPMTAAPPLLCNLFPHFALWATFGAVKKSVCVIEDVLAQKLPLFFIHRTCGEPG